MKKLTFVIALFAGLFLQSCKDEHADLKDGLYAEIETDKGAILVALEYKKSPITVANLITLAEGTNPFVREDLKDKNVFDGTRWHRVISKTNGDADDFVIQGGDPTGTGSGDVGYKFKDEFSDLRFDQEGMLAMANSGPGTNSSQFFITLAPTPNLDQRHTIFGKVIGDGMDIAHAIKQYDQVLSVTIIRKGEEAKKFDALKIFSDYFKAESEHQAKQAKIDAANLKNYQAEKQAYFANLKTKATVTKSGLAYYIVQKGNAGQPKMGDPIAVHYAGFFENGKLFDTSESDVARRFGIFKEDRAQMGGYAALPLKHGVKEGMIPGFAEGMNLLQYGDKAVIFIPSQLGYGENGMGNDIPPNTDLIFELQIDKP
jgi:peptidylprolyl isomerase